MLPQATGSFLYEVVIASDSRKNTSTTTGLTNYELSSTFKGIRLLFLERLYYRIYLGIRGWII
jgi:hypothetical protein